MDEDLAASVVEEAIRLGCRLFYFTGGEPTIYGAFPALCERILDEEDAHVVVLTNGLAARTLIPKLKDWSRERVHFQVSVDGSESSQDALRGEGAYRRTLRDVGRLRDAGFPVTLAMTVHGENVDEMPAVVELADELGLGNLHYLWLFRRGNAGEDLFVTPERIWPRLRELRNCSLATAPAYRANPLRFLVGGGDVDHSLSSGGEFTGHDPYVEIYNRLALWLIAREASRFPDGRGPGLRLRMGEYLHDCGEGGNGVMFTHSNCVLSLPGKDGHSLVREFYSAAAAETKEDILNPIQYAHQDISFIPEGARAPVLLDYLLDGEAGIRHEAFDLSRALRGGAD